MEIKQEIIKDLKEAEGDMTFELITNRGHELTKEELKQLAKELSFACYRMSKGDDMDMAMKGVAQELEDYGWVE